MNGHESETRTHERALGAVKCVRDVPRVCNVRLELEHCPLAGRESHRVDVGHHALRQRQRRLYRTRRAAVDNGELSEEVIN